MSWITTKSGKHINTDWFDDDARRREKQMQAAQIQAEIAQNQDIKSTEKSKSSTSNNDSWSGDYPWHDDLFEKNAKEKGLKIHTEKNKFGQEVDYVILKQNTTFYHATRKSLVNKIKKEGLKLQDKQGRQESGIYLSGGTHLNEWFGEDTALLKVTVHKGTRVYQDFQPNAVYIKTEIPPKDIQKLK